VPYFEFIWDDGENIPHLAEHGVTPEEAQWVVEHPLAQATSKTSGDPVVFGFTPGGRHLMVAYFHVDEVTVYVKTAYDAPPQTRRR
jgi:uncharacterized DUF497 family protein